MPKSMDLCPGCKQGILYLLQGVLYCSRNCGYSTPGGIKKKKEEKKKEKKK